jgi:uncharacterized protein (TIGR03437 family)
MVWNAGVTALALAFLAPLVALAQVQIASVVNGASFTGAPAPGSVATLFGSNLANATAAAQSVPLPTMLAGVTVSVNGMAAPLWYVSAGQINFEMPAEIGAGPPATVVVNSPGGASAPFSFNVPQAAPGIFSYGANLAVAVTQADNVLIDANHPVTAGTLITVYLNGLGPLDNPVPTNTEAPLQPPLSRPTLAASAAIGGQPAAIQFIGLTPGSIALAQANITVPVLGEGSYPVVITVGGVASNGPLIAVEGAQGASLPLSLLGSVSIGGLNHTSDVVVNGTTAYVCGTDQISVVNVSKPASPEVLSNFGQADLGGNGVFCVAFNNNLLEIVNQDQFYVYSLANPAAPQTLSGLAISPFSYTSDAYFVGSQAFFTTAWMDWDSTSNQVLDQRGDFYAFNFATPASPAFQWSLQGNSQPASSDVSPRFAAIAADNETAYIAGTTANGGNPSSGSAALQIVDVTNPVNMQALGEVTIPTAAVATAIATQGNLALVLGNTTGWRNPVTPNYDFTGTLTLTTLNISDHRNPVAINTLVTGIATAFTTGSRVVAPVGTGLFLVSIAPPADNNTGDPTGAGQLAIVDATDPVSLKVTPLASVPQLGEIAVVGNTLYAVTGKGLSIYRIGP